MKVQEVFHALEDFAPLALQDSFDNAGLQIGLPGGVDATGVLLCLDVTEDVVEEARQCGCNVIVSHHPLLFHPLKSVTPDDYIGRVVMSAIRHGIAIYAAHTNLDNAPGGVNHMMAECMGLSSLDWLMPKAGMDGGSGLVGNLAVPMPADEFIHMVADVFHVPCVRHNRAAVTSVSRVALCGGAGAFLLSDAIRCGAQAFVTGEIGYHRFFGHEADLLMLEIGHYESEQYTTRILHDIIHTACPTLPVRLTQTKNNPIEYN